MISLFNSLLCPLLSTKRPKVKILRCGGQTFTETVILQDVDETKTLNLTSSDELVAHKFNKTVQTSEINTKKQRRIAENFNKTHQTMKIMNYSEE